MPCEQHGTDNPTFCKYCDAEVIREMEDFEADLRNPRPLNKAHAKHLAAWERLSKRNG